MIDIRLRPKISSRNMDHPNGARSTPPAEGSPPYPEDRSSPEQEIQRFGSFGVGVTFGRPALFRWTKYNMHEIVLTGRRVCFIRKPSIARKLPSSSRARLDFQVPLADIVGIERLTFLGRRVVWLKWREGDGFREVSIEGGWGRGADIARLHRHLEILLGARPAAA